MVGNRTLELLNRLSRESLCGTKPQLMEDQGFVREGVKKTEFIWDFVPNYG